MNALEVKEVLCQKDMKFLYHVNSVATSLTYINNGGLLSRGAVDALGLSQTIQTTDSSDKIHGVYDDVFFDSTDIHSRAKKINDYGVVSFVFDINFLNEFRQYEVKITKSNPKYWTNGMSEKDKYFCSRDELFEGFYLGNFAQEITICHITEAVGFNFLEKIVVDNPKISNTSYFNDAVHAIENALSYNRINIPVVIRDCPTDCRCKEQYNRYKEGYTYYKFKTTV